MKKIFLGFLISAILTIFCTHRIAVPMEQLFQILLTVWITTGVISTLILIFYSFFNPENGFELRKNVSIWKLIVGFFFLNLFGFFTLIVLLILFSISPTIKFLSEKE